jgi:hypothetical protein
MRDLARLNLFLGLVHLDLRGTLVSHLNGTAADKGTTACAGAQFRQSHPY